MTWSVWTMIHPTFAGISRRAFKASVSICMSALLSGCTTYKFSLNYKKIKSEMPLSPNAVKGERLGYVVGESGGFIWSGCHSRAEMSLNELVENAEAMGADSVGNIIWDATGTSEPGCRRGWVYAVLWPMLLTPMFMNTRVEGVAYRKIKKAEFDPETDRVPASEDTVQE